MDDAAMSCFNCLIAMDSLAVFLLLLRANTLDHSLSIIT
jgi:hypothetical protein